METSDGVVLRRCIRRLKYRLTISVRLLEEMVRSYGMVEGLLWGSQPATNLNDLFYFCIAKGTRSLLAARATYEAGFPIESATLVRCAYEAYLRGAFARHTATDDELRSLTPGAIGRLWAPDQQLDRIQPGFKYMANSLSRSSESGRLDGLIHDWLYEQLSAASHPDFALFSTAVEPGTPFFVIQRSEEGGIFPLVASVYVALLLLMEAGSFEDLDPPHPQKLPRCAGQGLLLLEDCLSVITAIVKEAARTGELPTGMSLPGLNPEYIGLMVERLRLGQEALQNSILRAGWSL